MTSTTCARLSRKLLPISAAAVSLILAAGVLGAAPEGQDWPQWRGPNADGVWKEQGLLAKFSQPDLPIKWRAPISNGYSGPTVAKGRVYVTDRVVEPTEQERVLCLDAETGKELWKHAYAAEYKGIGYANGPRAAVTVNDGRAYALGAMGAFLCFNAADGKVHWSKDLNTAYRIRMPTWGISAAPVVHGDSVILHIGGSDGACFVALDRKTGAERWKAIADAPGYAPPVLTEQAGQPVLVCWSANQLAGLDPRTGKVHWTFEFPARVNVDSVATPVIAGERLFVSAFYEGSLMLRLPKDQLTVEKIWQRRGASELATDALHSLIPTPILDGEQVYGIDSFGELRGLDAKTGERLWLSQEAVPRARFATAHLVKNGDKTWIFNEKGQLLITRLTPAGRGDTEPHAAPEADQGPVFGARGSVLVSPGFCVSPRVCAER